MPLKTRVVDADTGAPIEGATVLRVVCDLHDFRCTGGNMETSKTDKHGEVELSGKRKWGLWIPAPGGLPAPNHQIAIWKSGYQAFVFSQYGSINDIESGTDRDDVKKAIHEVPKNRKDYTPDDNPLTMFEGGFIELKKE